MTALEQLSTISEVAIALGGFSALVAILQGSGEKNPKAEAFRLQMMLEASLFVVALSLAPGVVRELGPAEANVWRISAALFLFLDIVIGISAWIRGRDLAAEYDWATKITVYALSYIADILVILILLGIHPFPAHSLYLLAIYLNLILAGMIFIRFAAVNFGRER